MTDKLIGGLAGRLAETTLLASQYRRERDEALAILSEALAVIHGEFCGGSGHHTTCEELTERRDALLGREAT